jgi:hypothetical protein
MLEAVVDNIAYAKSIVLARWPRSTALAASSGFHSLRQAQRKLVRFEPRHWFVRVQKVITLLTLLRKARHE